MRRWIGLVVLLQGCATQLDLGPPSASGGPDAATARQVLQFRKPSLTLDEDRVLARQEDLRPGDIILTVGPGLTAAGIQLMSLGPVSHAALYIGDGQVVEARLPGVRVGGLQELLAGEIAVVALRYPDLSEEQAAEIRTYALRQVGAPFNFLGLMLHMPLSIQRTACELPLAPRGARVACIRAVGNIQQLSPRSGQFFCSQLVLQAYRHAGVPITDADPRIVRPADILHMRQGDVPSIRVSRQLAHVGLLKRPPPAVAALE
jgi:cell wall-associated NlpC family hydrolase